MCGKKHFVISANCGMLKGYFCKLWNAERVNRCSVSY